MSRTTDRRDFLRAAALATVSVLTPRPGRAAQRADAPNRKKPNIVFILVDDMGFKDPGCNGGYIKTPNIDKLAARGTKLNQFYVQPVCSPTRSSLMTGRYPMRCGLQVGVVRPWAQHGLPLNERTLAQALKQAGYVTAIHGKWHLGHLDSRYLPTARGFDHQYGHYNGALDYFTHIRDRGLDWNRDDKPLREEGYTTDLIARESARLIAAHDTSRPLFLYVPFNAVHSPFQAPKSYIDMYPDVKPTNRRIYAAMLTCMDDAIGRIVAALDDRRMTANTLIIFCSDNGGVGAVSDNGPFRGQKGSLYEGGIRAAALAVWPGVIPAGIDGKDAWPAIAHGRPSPHDEILHNVTPATGAIRIGDYKLVWNGQIRANYTGQPPKENRYELFNLAEDPSEKTNLIDTHPDKFAHLKRRLAHHAAAAAKPNIPPNRPPPNFKTPKSWGHPD